MQLSHFLLHSLVVAKACSAAMLKSSAAPLSTISIAIPSEGKAFTSTLKACGTVPGAVIEGVPTGIFEPGTQTIFLPPQASETTTTFINEVYNLTQVVIASPLPGSCEPLSLPADATATVVPDSSPTPTKGPSACPLKGCSKGVNAAAQKIIAVLDEVTSASQRLQVAAKQLDFFSSSSFSVASPAGGGGDEGGVSRFGFGTVSDIVIPLKDIVATLNQALAGLSKRNEEPPSVFPPGCSSDTIVVALIDFVEVHTALLEIFIGKSPDEEDVRRRVMMMGADGGNATVEGAQEAFGFGVVAAAIQGVLRAVETVVDDFVYDLIGLVPTYDKCIQRQQKGLDTVLKEAIAAYN